MSSRAALWAAHREAHRRNFANRYSETAERPDPDERLKPPRYWLVHTFAHVLLREMAMRSGYGSASLSERIYAWPGTDARPPAAGLLICTTASDSDGTLGGLVALSEPDRLASIVVAALTRARRCSSDPLCAMRTPREPEDFLHGAACHCCTMASETSCERANRFLDRRFLVALPGSDCGFFNDRGFFRRGSGRAMGGEPGASGKLAAYLTGLEAKEIADRLEDDATLTGALQAVAVARRVAVRELLGRAGLGVACREVTVAVLRAVEGAHEHQTRITPVWTTPGDLAQYGHLTTSVRHYVDGARESVVCATFNFQRSSALWQALARAAARPEVAVRILPRHGRCRRGAGCLEADHRRGGPGDARGCRVALSPVGGRPGALAREVRRRRPPGPACDERELLAVG